MRIVAGEWRGRAIKAPQGETTRPTADRTRETLFNMLASRLGSFEGLSAADLFAGSGALGLEALSRGAARVSFVDDGMTARALIRANVERARAKDVTDLWRRDATRLGPVPDRPFGMIFLDPPYGAGLGEAAIASALQGGWIAPGAMIAWEEARGPIVPAPLVRIDQRRYGDTWVTLARLPEG